MSLTKEYVLYDQYKAALQELNKAIKFIKEENLKNILLLRASKIYIETNNIQSAKNILKKIKSNAWINIIENIKGDTFSKIDLNSEAIRSWKNSQKKEYSYAFKKIIKMKIEALKEK